MTSTLYRLVNIEVEYAQWSYLADYAAISRDEQLTCSYLEQANNCIGLFIHSQVQTLIIPEKSHRACDSRRKLLRFRAGCAHVVDYHRQLVAFTHWSLARSGPRC